MFEKGAMGRSRFGLLVEFIREVRFYVLSAEVAEVADDCVIMIL